MSRRSAREIVLHLIFSHDFLNNSAEDLLESRLTGEKFEMLADECDLYAQLPAAAQIDYVEQAVRGVIDHAPELDAYIEKYAVGWSVGRISRVTRAVLRLCMYETLYMQIPVAASVNEAVELVRKYDSDEACAFANGVLGAFVRNELKK